VDRVDAFEIEPAVVEASAHFDEMSGDPRGDPRLRLVVGDARARLRRSPETYDVIISEPSNPWIAGIAGLFTVEFLANARDKLTPGGIFALWFHEYDQSDAGIALILRTLYAVFPHVTLFHEQSYADVVAIASVDPLAIDFAELERRFDEPAVRGDLTRIGIANLAALLSHNAVSPARFPELLGDGPLNRLNHQRLEYESLRAMFRGEFSELVQRFNPLLDAGAADSDVLLDRYLAYRAGTGEPVRREELGEAALHMSTLGAHAEEIRRSLLARAERAAPGAAAATRAARGAIPEPGEAGFYEADYWARRYSAANEIARAIAFDRRALALRPEATAVAARLSDLLVASDDLKGAAQLIDTMLARLPDDTTLLGQRGWLFIRERRFADARTALTKLAAQRAIPAIDGMIAHLLVLEGRPGEAEPLYASVARRERDTINPPRLWQVTSLMARILDEQGEREGALAIVDRALQIDPAQPNLLAQRDAWQAEAR
jgi:tetratricopeptide (TPR) repeat protein